MTALTGMLAASAMLLLGCEVTSAAEQDSAQPTRDYLLDYHITIDSGDYANVEMTVTQSTRNLRRVTLKPDGDQFVDISAAQGIETGADGITWQVPESGGTLRWRAKLNRQRADGSFDAIRRKQWALFRTEDVIPPIASATRVGAHAITTMRIDTPAGWSVETAYPGDESVFSIEDQGRRFDHPDGWVVAGDIGVRYDVISNTTVSIAAPRDQDARRLDVMAFVNWHLPYIRSLLPEFPRRLLIAMAGDPFFRGGLSAPNSLFMHTDRPMISGNGTSTLVHELMHVGIGRSGARDADWIVEGLAEYYSAIILYRAGTVTGRRHRSTMRSLRKWSEEATTLRERMSSGPTTALAVTVFAKLDAEIRERSKDTRSLDDVLQELAMGDGELDLDELRAAAATVIGKPAQTLANAALPGYAQ